MNGPDPDRPVTLTLPASRALKIAAAVYGWMNDFEHAGREGSLTPEAAALRVRQCEMLARMFEEAVNQPELPGTEETALGKL